MKTLTAFVIGLMIPLMGQAQPADEAQYATVGTVAYGDIGAGYGTALTVSQSLAYVDILNTADCAIFVSFNASTNHFVVPSNSALSIDLREMAMKESSNVSIKKYTGATCSSGNVFVSAVLQ